MADTDFKFTDASEADIVAQIRARILWNGPSKSGKTYSCLKVATELAKLLAPAYGFTPTIYLADTERDSALLYRNKFKFKHLPFNPPHSTLRYLKMLEYFKSVARPGDIFILDSGSHAWMGPGGILSRLDSEAARFGGNTHKAWAVLTPEQNKFIDMLLGLNQHLFMTTRAKTEWEDREVNGKKKPTKVGYAPIQRDGLEYEFTVEINMDEKHVAHIGGTRIESIDGEEYIHPDEKLARPIFSFLMTGRGDATPEEIAAGIERHKSDPKVQKLAGGVSPPSAKPTPPSAPVSSGTAASVEKPTEKTPTPTNGSQKSTPVSISEPTQPVAPATNGEATTSAPVSVTTPASERVIEAPATGAMAEHDRLAALLVQAIEVNDKKTLRGFPTLVSKASEAGALDRAGYDDLVQTYTSWKKAQSK